MKKTYITPNARAIQLNFEGMIANSNNSGIQVASEDTTMESTGDYLSNRRRTNIWGEEY